MAQLIFGPVQSVAYKAFYNVIMLLSEEIVCKEIFTNVGA